MRTNIRSDQIKDPYDSAVATAIFDRGQALFYEDGPSAALWRGAFRRRWDTHARKRNKRLHIRNGTWNGRSGYFCWATPVKENDGEG